MDQHDDFDSVSWKHEPDSDASRPTTSGTEADESYRYDHDTNGKRRMSAAQEEPQAGPMADAVDLAGIGDGVLECRVDTPLKENDGTKDAYISYLVTTHVSDCIISCPAELLLSTCRVHIPISIKSNQEPPRPISSPSRNLISAFAEDSPISISCTRHSTANTQRALCHRCRTSTRWSMCEETGSARNSLHDERGHCIDS